MTGACADRDQSGDCYPEDPAPGAMFGVHQLVCGEPWGTMPETPSGIAEDRGPFHVGLCEEPVEGSSCAACPAEDVNARIEAHLLEVMNGPEGCAPGEIDHIEPACVTTPEQGSSTGCCFSAWYWGSCNIKD